MKSNDLQERVSQAAQQLSSLLLGWAASCWQTLQDCTEIAQEVAKDPFTSEVKAQAATAELLLVLLHVCDRVASAAFSVALPAQPASVLRNAFMTALVGVTVPAFARLACPEEDPEEQQETQADLLHLYHVRSTQYGCFARSSTTNP